MLPSWPVSDRLGSFSGCSWVNAGAVAPGAPAPFQPDATSRHASRSASVQNRERRVRGFSSLAFVRAGTEMFLPEQLLHFYLKEDFGTWQPSSSPLQWAVGCE